MIAILIYLWAGLTVSMVLRNLYAEAEVPGWDWLRMLRIIALWPLTGIAEFLVVICPPEDDG
jgi:hypothetical protein